MVELVFSETFDVEDGLWWQTEGEKLGLVVTVRMIEARTMMDQIAIKDDTSET
jgi:hypothetical protein